MKIPDLTTAKGRSVAISVVVLVGASAWGWSRAGNTEHSTLPDELSAEALQERMTSLDNPLALRDSIRRIEMTDEQRQELRRNLRLASRAIMRERMNEYFNADPADKEDVLDRHIDEFAARRDAWRERRQQRQRDGERRVRPTPTKQQQKARTENRKPDETAQQMVYFAALRAQAEARGVSIGRRGGGIGGGPRGGRGGGGNRP